MNTRRALTRARGRLAGVAGLVLGRLPAPVRDGIRRLAYAGSRRACPLCGRTARVFLPAGRRRDRADALCPWCGSLERHRFAWLYLQRATPVLAGGRMLHLAPEPALTAALGGTPVRAITSDIEPAGVDVAADLTALCFADGVFESVYCSHVLEHVQDDRAAMREIRRVLRPGGIALVQVPVRRGPTYEDPSITTPEGRLAAFAQEDHVRHYGPDIVDRLQAVGFRVTTARPADLFPNAEIRRFALAADEPLFRCERHG